MEPIRSPDGKGTGSLLKDTLMPHLNPRFLLPALVLSISAISHAGTLKVGDPAPPLPVAEWIKGAPVKSFEPGQTYVVEFWATWCGPCKVSIPHLTELAKTYSGKVTFAGISVLEKKSGPKDTSYMKGVKAFVKEQGDRMGYSVGIDGPEGILATTWVKASGTPGIPTAIVVNGQGRIHWIGHPMELGPVLKAIQEGTFDEKSAAAKREAETNRRVETEKAMKPFFEAMKKADYLEASRLGASLFTRFPDVEQAFGYIYYQALSHTDAAKADAYGRALSQGAYKDNSLGLGALASAMLENPAQDLQLTLQVANRALALAKDPNDPRLLDLCAKARARASRTN